MEALECTKCNVCGILSNNKSDGCKNPERLQTIAEYEARHDRGELSEEESSTLAAAFMDTLPTEIVKPTFLA